jgi:mannose/fructose/N-acetylgalactosamine-specific phosphotransferase system component IIB
MVRVDDRLLHGQVIVGWGHQFELNRLIVASDRIKQDQAYVAAVRSLVPTEIEASVETLQSAADQWRDKSLSESRAMIVLESTGDALKLMTAGAPLKQITLGGLHFREESEELLPYIYLSRWDRVALKELMDHGVRIVCQDLPASKPVPYTG